jgi:hypothetical protein
MIDYNPVVNQGRLRFDAVSYCASLYCYIDLSQATSPNPRRVCTPDLLCDNTVRLYADYLSTGNRYVCNCDGPANSTIVQDVPVDDRNYRPTNCTTPPAVNRTTLCNLADTFKACLFVEFSSNTHRGPPNWTESDLNRAPCSFMRVDSGDPSRFYDHAGLRVCDGTIQNPDASYVQPYACKCRDILELVEDWRHSTPNCPPFQLSRSFLVDANATLGQVRNTTLDLTPVIDEIVDT